MAQEDDHCNRANPPNPLAVFKISGRRGLEAKIKFSDIFSAMGGIMATAETESLRRALRGGAFFRF